METTEKLRVVLDTNIVLSALSPKLPYRHILRRAIQGEFGWFVTTEILLEYEEKITEFFGEEIANTFLEALLFSRYTHRVEVFYRFNVLNDLDDNKFLDCAFAANAHFIVSEDKAFASLAQLAFPKMTRLQLAEFSAVLEQAAQP
jgi:putative PIN family toxin of toxin-antitoxin system